mmetsp:Transcript_4384/g.14402  ORF Transcript_4384/g.14402 Transcript_4384/m.14402 type:complete len:300 (-) Transcript_4384:182-1081(-)
MASAPHPHATLRCSSSRLWRNVVHGAPPSWKPTTGWPRARPSRHCTCTQGWPPEGTRLRSTTWPSCWTSITSPRRTDPWLDSRASLSRYAPFPFSGSPRARATSVRSSGWEITTTTVRVSRWTLRRQRTTTASQPTRATRRPPSTWPTCTHTASASLRTCTWPSGTTTWPSTCPPRPTCPCSSPCSSCGSSAGGKRARAAPTRPPLSYGGFWPPRGQRREPRYWGPRRRGYRKEGGWRPSGGSSICTSSGTRFSCACSPRRSALSSRCASGSKRAGSWRGATRPLAELEHASHVWRAEM